MTEGRHLGESREPHDVSDATQVTDMSEHLDREPADHESAEVVRHEERAVIGTETVESGRVRVRKHVETLPVEEAVSRSVEHADSERVPVLEGDSGEVETLPDGSVSIPVFEEVLVVTKKLVVRERIVVRKHTVVDEHVLHTELRREHVTVDADGDIEVDDRTRTTSTTPAPPVDGSTSPPQG